MDAPALQIPLELKQALIANGTHFLHLKDEETKRAYLLVEQGTLSTLDEEFLKAALDEALEDEGAGRVSPLDFEEIKREGRRLLAERSAKRLG